MAETRLNSKISLWDLLVLSLPAKVQIPSSSSPSFSSNGVEKENKAAIVHCNFKPQPAQETVGAGSIYGARFLVGLLCIPSLSWDSILPATSYSHQALERWDAFREAGEERGMRCCSGKHSGTAGSEDARDEENSLSPFWQPRSSELGHLS